MFDEMPHDQFYQFLAAAASRAAAANNTVTTNTTTTTPLPITFSLHHNNHHDGSSYPTSFDLSTYSLSPPQPQPPQQQQQQQGFLPPPPHLLHHTHLPLHLQPNKIEVKEQSIGPPAAGLDHPIDHPSWSNDEVLALLRIRSTMDNNWFPDFTWENVSRKLGELGFKRSAEKCKEKFEEETRSFNSSIINTNNTATATATDVTTNDNNSKNVSPSSNSNSYRLFGELEELCNNSNKHHHQGDNQQSSTQEEYDQPQTITSDKGESQEKQKADEDKQVEGDKPVEGREKDERERDGDKEDEGKGNDDNVGDEHSLDDSEKTEETSKRVMRKRKRERKFEMFQGFCENIVNKMMAQQEQLHAKILRDMVKRDEEKVAREEAWKKQEIERIKKEMEVRAHEQTIAGDRQAKILAFLKKFASSNAVECQSLREAIENLLKVQNASPNSLIMTQDCIVSGQPTTSSCATHDQNPSSMVTQKCASITTSSNENLGSDILNRVENSKSAPPMSSTSSLDKGCRNPNALVSTHKSSVSSNHTSSDGTGRVTNLGSSEIKIIPKPNVEKTFADDTGRRWPRDEVLALINIRCSLFNSTGEPLHDRESSVKGPLWERISQKMLELGYQRSAKRCKEKWENINKYFRKTKDLNKKRSVDSRTCPYFHQLSHLYNQATIVGSPENKLTALPSAQGAASDTPGGAPTTLHGCQGNGNEGVVQVPTCDFDV